MLWERRRHTGEHGDAARALGRRLAHRSGLHAAGSRGHGYGSAVTAAAADLARCAASMTSCCSRIWPTQRPTPSISASASTPSSTASGSTSSRSLPRACRTDAPGVSVQTRTLASWRAAYRSCSWRKRKPAPQVVSATGSGNCSAPAPTRTRPGRWPRWASLGGVRQEGRRPRRRAAAQGRPAAEPRRPGRFGGHSAVPGDRPRGRRAHDRRCGRSTFSCSARCGCWPATSSRWPPARARRWPARSPPPATRSAGATCTSSPSTTTWPAATPNGWARCSRRWA